MSAPMPLDEVTRRLSPIERAFVANFARAHGPVEVWKSKLAVAPGITALVQSVDHTSGLVRLTPGKTVDPATGICVSGLRLGRAIATFPGFTVTIGRVSNERGHALVLVVADGTDYAVAIGGLEGSALDLERLITHVREDDA